jgi:hypothetical protein
LHLSFANGWLVAARSLREGSAVCHNRAAKALSPPEVRHPW